MRRSGDGGASDEDDRSKKGKSTDKRGSQSGTRQSNANSSMHGQKSEEDYNRSPTFDTSSTSSTSFLGTKSRKLMSQKHFIREASPLGVEGSISESVQTTFRLNPAVKKLRGMSVIQADTTNANTLVVNVNGNVFFYFHLLPACFSHHVLTISLSFSRFSTSLFQRAKDWSNRLTKTLLWVGGNSTVNQGAQVQVVEY